MLSTLNCIHTAKVNEKKKNRLTKYRRVDYAPSYLKKLSNVSNVGKYGTFSNINTFYSLVSIQQRKKTDKSLLL